MTWYVPVPVLPRFLRGDHVQVLRLPLHEVPNSCVPMSSARNGNSLQSGPMQKLASTGELAYLGHQWRRSVACAGGDLPMQGDISARTLLFNVPDVDPSRRQRLIDLLDIDLEWHMHCVSDGQRRRVQICMGLLKPFKVLLMDEVCNLRFLGLCFHTEHVASALCI